MKKIYKRLSAVFLALVIVTGSVLGNGFVAQADVYGDVLFSDEFNKEYYGTTKTGSTKKNKMTDEKGWNPSNNTQGNYIKTDDENYIYFEKYVVPYDAQINIQTVGINDESNAWTDYSVEADMIFDSTNAGSGVTYAGISGRLNNTNIAKGYDLMVIKESATATDAKLQLRFNTSVLKQVDISSLSNDVAFTLKLEFRGTNIYGYINNELKLSYDTVNDSAKNTSGWGGIRKVKGDDEEKASGMAVIYDDFVVTEIIEQDYPDGYLYYNNFDSNPSLADSGMGTAENATISDGSLNLGINGRVYLDNVIDAVNWTDYIVEADAQIVKTETDTAEEGYASIVARSSATTDEGYEYRMYYKEAATNKKTLVLYKRNHGDNETIATYPIDFEFNQYYKLTMAVHGNEVMCWFGDQIIFDWVDSDSKTDPLLSGYAGIRSPGRTNLLSSKYDNFGVKEYTAPTFTYPEGYFYFNDFDLNFRLKTEGWRSEGAKEGGVYKLNGGATNYLTRVDDAATWTDYVVEADVSIIDDSTLPQHASIVARTTDTSNMGYEYRISKDDTGTFLHLYKRGSSSGRINGEIYKYYMDIDVTASNEMKMVVKGNELICYFNGNLIFEVIDTDNPYLAGYTGVRSATGSAQSTYNDYGVRAIKDTDLPTNAAYPEGYLYFNDFSTRRDLSKEGFTNTGDKTGGVYTLAASARNYLTEVEGSSEWTDYVVEADVSIVDNGELPQHASITARCDVDENRGYEYRITKEDSGETCLWLYKRGSSSGKINGESHKYYMDIDVAKSHEMKIVVNGSDIICYFDGELIFEVVDKEAYTKGYAGVRSATGTAASTYDNYAVREIQATDLPMNDGYPEGYLYLNNFSTRRDLTKEGWDTTGTKANGLYHLPGSGYNYLTNVEGSADWTDYVVEADIAIIDDSDETVPQYASIIARSSNKTSDGYEYRMTKDETGTYLRLYKRGVDSGRINGKVYKYDMDIDVTETHKMKMVVNGNDIICYFDDALIFEVTDEEAYTKGYTGVRSPKGATATSTYGNYVVREIQSTDIPADAVYEEGVLYYNDFSTNRNLVKEGWMGKATKKDGTLVLKGSSYDYLTNLKGASEWTDYVVEADFMLNDDGTNPQYASIVARTTKTKDEGYEYRIYQDEKGTYVWLYKRGSDSGVINGKSYKMKVGIVSGEMNAMKMVVQGANIICYFNGMKLFDVVDEDPYLTGYTGVRSPAGTATSTYDNYTVRKIQHGDIVKDKVLTKLNEDVWFYDDFKDDTSLSDRGWHTDKVVLYDGAVAPIGRLYVDGIEDCANWTDYEVSAVVRVDIDAGLQEGYTNGKSSICARSLSSTTGYEYGIIAIPGSVPYLRLYDRATDTNLAVDKSVKITEGEHTLSMICVGNEIYCYFDGTFVFAAQSNSAAAGYAGVRASGYNTYYKNFAIKKANVVATVVKPGTATGVTSPHTGTPVAYTAMMNLTMAAFVISAIGLVVTLVYGRRRES